MKPLKRSHLGLRSDNKERSHFSFFIADSEIVVERRGIPSKLPNRYLVYPRFITGK